MPTCARQLGETAGRINGALRRGRLDADPLRQPRYSRTTLAGLYRAAARAALVTPLRDGMNLVAKEYVAAQDPDDPGVLILSRFAGAARECQAALLVNPYDPEGVATAIDRALSMPLDERKQRHAANYRRAGRERSQPLGRALFRAFGRPAGPRFARREVGQRSLDAIDLPHGGVNFGPLD